MIRLIAPLLLVLATTTPVLAGGFVFEIPRLVFPSPDAPVATDSLSTRGG